MLATTALGGVWSGIRYAVFLSALQMMKLFLTYTIRQP